MKQFTFTITESVGLHGRPAGLLVRAVKNLGSRVTVANRGGHSSAGDHLISLMRLGILRGDTITVTLEGKTEEEDAQILEAFFKENL